MLTILYQDNHTLIAQTHAGKFNKWGDDLYGEHNMGMHVGDDSECVLNNRAKLLTALNELTHQSVKEIHWLNQIHSDIVIDVDDVNDVNNGNNAIKAQDGDALISANTGMALSIMTADCVPIALFNDNYDKKSQIACIHAGWQGLTKGIIKNTANQFHGGNIKAVIGACISQKNYEINKPLACDIIQSVVDKQLVNLSFDELYQAIIIDKDDDINGKCLIDIVKLTRLQLSYLNIDVINNDVPCSYDEPNLYSYRQQTHAKKTATGRMAMVIVRF